jgi:hypothetical protein
MSALIDLTGKRFGRLLVLKRAPGKPNKPRWLCLCDCGNTTTVAGLNLRLGHTRSCGRHGFSKQTMAPR